MDGLLGGGRGGGGKGYVGPPLKFFLGEGGGSPGPPLTMPMRSNSGNI